MVKIVQEAGINFGKIQVVDSVQTIADVNLAKDERRQREEIALASAVDSNQPLS